MKSIFINKTKYTKKIYNEFLDFHKNTFTFKDLSSFFVIVSLLIFLIVVQVIHNKLLIVLFLLVSILVLIFLKFIKPVKNVEKDFKSDKIANEETITFEFFNKTFSISTKDDIVIRKYSSIYKVFETNNFFYIYINKNHAYILDKTNFIYFDTSFYKTLFPKEFYNNSYDNLTKNYTKAFSKFILKKSFLNYTFKKK